MDEVQCFMTFFSLDMDVGKGWNSQTVLSCGNDRLGCRQKKKKRDLILKSDSLD